MIANLKDPYLPEALSHLENEKIWVCFSLIPQENGKLKKIPINPHSGKPAKINAPSTWGSFKEARMALRDMENDPSSSYKPHYLGFAVTPEIGVIFIDLDNVIDSDTGAILPEALMIVEKVNSYTEYSQSQKGLHIYAKGQKNTAACRSGFLEVYDRNRFACITNDPYGEIRPFREASPEVSEICDRYFLKSPNPEKDLQNATLLSLDEEVILEKASSAKNSAKFKKLYYEGNIEEYGGDESAADLALMNLLTFYTRDEEQLERLFSQSALGTRSKWTSRPDYRKRTIEKALSSVQQAYKEPSPSSRPEVLISQGELHLATDQAEQILLRDCGIYQRAGRLVRVISAPTKPLNKSSNKSIIRSENTYIITEVTIPYLTETLTKKALWIKLNGDGDKKYIDCPEKIAKTLIARAQWDLPVLRGLIYTPTLRSNGSILDKPGYDTETGLLLLDRGLSWDSIPDNPTKEDALNSIEELRVPIKEFCFVNPESKSVAISGILTALIRKAIPTAPMIGITAPKMGSGKSLLADCIALIATGKPNSVLSAAENEIEERKRLFSVLLEGDLMICYDNIEHPFGSPSLCSVLSQREFKDRILGGSSTAAVSTESCFLATGNNLNFIGDLTTRTLLCQLDPQVEKPEERSFSIDLHKYIPEHRPQLIKAGLTILRAYHVAGRPVQDIKQFGRFEEWSDWIRSALVWLGLPDPCLTRENIESEDPVGTSIGNLLSNWHSIFGSSPIKVKKLIEQFKGNDDQSIGLREALFSLNGSTKEEVTERWLGNKLKKFKNRIERGHRLEIAGESQGTTLWKVVKIDSARI